MKRNKWLAGMLGVLLIGTVAFPVQAKDTDIREKTITYQTKDKEEEKSFPETETFDGNKYVLKNVTYESLKSEPEKEKKVVEYTEKSDPIVKGSEYQFPEEKTVDGIVYKLKEITEQESEPYKQSVSAYNEYQYEISHSSAPQTKEVSVKNEKTGEMETVTCNLSTVHLVDHTWIDSKIDITFQGYDRNAIEWEGIVFPNDRGVGAPLKGYETQLLASVGLDDSNGKIQNTYYTSDMYTDANGIVCRNAQADIQKLVPVYRAEYIGEINTPHVVKTAVYEGEQEVDSRTDINYTIEATAVYQKVDNQLSYILAGVGILVGVALIIIILMILARKRKEKEHATTKIDD